MPPITLIDSTGTPTTLDDTDPRVPGLVAQGYHVEGAQDTAARQQLDARQASTSSAEAFAHGFGDVASLGLMDPVLVAQHGEDARRRLNLVKDTHSTANVVGGLAGAVFDPLGTMGALGEAGGAVSGALAGEGAGALRSIGAAAAGHATEGALIGLGQGASDLALDSDPLTAEHVLSSLSSHALLGAGIGGAAGTLGKVAEKGLVRARGALDAAQAANAVPEDLAGLDIKGLKGAESSELEKIEAARVPQREALAKDIGSFREDLKGLKMGPALKGGLVDGEGNRIAELADVSPRLRKVDASLDRLLDNPIGLAKAPGKALDALEIQQAALNDLIEHTPRARAGIELDRATAPGGASEVGATRSALLDAAPELLERNKALQARIAELKAEPMSERLKAVRDAKDMLTTSKAQGESLAEKLGGSAGYSVGAGLAHLIPGGSFAAPFIGAKAADLGKALINGKLAAAVAEQAGKMSSAVDALTSAAKPLAKAPIPLATKVLSRVAYAPAPAKGAIQPHPSDDGEPHPKRELHELYAARAAELRSQTAPGPDGKPVMTPQARAAMQQNISPIRMWHPMLADALEALTARKVEFLAGKLPTQPDLPSLGKSDPWRPADMQMRTFARYAAAAEDPSGVEERLAHGMVSPEDAEAYRAVYPERFAAFVQNVMEKLPTLRKSLPYAKRIALSIFTGQPVDPAMSPRILATLQGQFSNDPGTQGGMSAPKASPQFGAIKAPEPTQSQRGYR